MIATVILWVLLGWLGVNLLAVAWLWLVGRSRHRWYSDARRVGPPQVPPLTPLQEQAIRDALARRRLDAAMGASRRGPRIVH